MILPEIISINSTSRTSLRNMKKIISPSLLMVCDANIQGCTQNWDLDKYWTFEYFYRKYKNMKFKVGVDDEGFKLTAPLKYFL